MRAGRAQGCSQNGCSPTHTFRSILRDPSESPHWAGGVWSGDLHGPDFMTQMRVEADLSSPADSQCLLPLAVPPALTRQPLHVVHHKPSKKIPEGEKQQTATHGVLPMLFSQQPKYEHKSNSYFIKKKKMEIKFKKSTWLLILTILTASGGGSSQMSNWSWKHFCGQAGSPWGCTFLLEDHPFSSMEYF